MSISVHEQEHEAPAQGALTLPREPVEVDLDQICRQPTFGAALVASLSIAGHVPKGAYIPLAIQKSYWSGICDDTKSFPIKGSCVELMRFQDEICGHHGPLFWLAHRSGFDPRSMRRYQTITEVERDAARARLADVERENALLRGLVQGRAA